MQTSSLHYCVCPSSELDRRLTSKSISGGRLLVQSLPVNTSVVLQVLAQLPSSKVLNLKMLQGRFTVGDFPLCMCICMCNVLLVLKDTRKKKKSISKYLGKTFHLNPLLPVHLSENTITYFCNSGKCLCF